MQTVLAAFLGAASTLASLNLVFLGITTQAFQRNHGTERDKGSKHYRRLATISLVAFILGVLDIAVTALALLADDLQRELLPYAAGGFFVQLLALVVLAGYIVRAVL